MNCPTCSANMRYYTPWRSTIGYWYCKPCDQIHMKEGA